MSKLTENDVEWEVEIKKDEKKRPEYYKVTGVSGSNTNIFETALIESERTWEIVNRYISNAKSVVLEKLNDMQKES